MKEQPAWDSTTAIALLSRANELRQQKDYMSALAIYLEIQQKFGETATLLAMIAHCHFWATMTHQQGENGYKEAILWLKKAIALEPDNARFYTELGQYYWMGNLDYEQAVWAYRRALELNLNHLQALNSAVILYDTPERVIALDEAINWLERASRLEPYDPTIHYWLGNFYYKASRQHDARREWLMALLCPEPLASGPVEIVEKALNARDAP